MWNRETTVLNSELFRKAQGILSMHHAKTQLDEIFCHSWIVCRRAGWWFLLHIPKNLLIKFCENYTLLASEPILRTRFFFLDCSELSANSWEFLLSNCWVWKKIHACCARKKVHVEFVLDKFVEPLCAVQKQVNQHKFLKSRCCKLATANTNFIRLENSRVRVCRVGRP